MKAGNYLQEISQVEHRYSDYPTHQSLIERIVDGAGREEFLRRLKSELSHRMPEKEAGKSAKKLYQDAKSQSLGAEERKTIRAASEKGVFEDFSLDRAWHPYSFFSDDYPTTFPFQHPTCVLYSGQSKHVFFSKLGKQDILSRKNYDEFVNPGSILEQGLIKRSEVDEGFDTESALYLTHNLDYTTDEKFGGNSEHGIYDSSLVIEAEVPSKWLIIKDHSTGSERFQGLEGLMQRYQNPGMFREEAGNVEFQLTETGLPLNYITGVWDLESNEEPRFLPLEEYHRDLFRRFPFRVPSNPEKVGWSLEKKFVRQARKKFLESKGLRDHLNVVSDFLSNQEEILSILGFEQGSGGSVAESLGKDAGSKASDDLRAILELQLPPHRCPLCDTPNDENGYCQSCGKELFIAEYRLKRLQKMYQTLRILSDNPLKFEELVSSGRMNTVPIRYLENLVKRCIEYEEELEPRLKVIIKYLDAVNAEKIEKRLEQDIESADQDLRSITG